MAYRSVAIRRPKGSPVLILGKNPLESTDLQMRNMRLRTTERGAALLHLASGFVHQLAKFDHGEITGAKSLSAAVGDRAHRLPHRDVLIGNAAYAREVAELHGIPVLQIVIL